MAINGNNKFFRSKRNGIVCCYCNGTINKDKERGGFKNQWVGWNRQRGDKSRSWHWDCDRAEEIPPYELQFHKSDLGTDATFENTDASVVKEDDGSYSNVDTAPVAVEPAVVEVPPVAVPVNGDPTSGLLKTLADLLLPYIDGRINGKVAGFEKQIADAVRDAIAKATPVTRVEIVKPDGSSIVVDGVHKQFPELLGLCSIRQWAYLYGLPGGFKSTCAAQVAKALGLAFESIQLTKTTMASELKGYKDANGVYQASGFRRCYENGGIFLIDEIDNGAGNLLTVLNSALANGHYGFPDRMVERHPDFICIATGNTCGRGASKNHKERVELDAATMERFQVLEWEHDWDLAKAITLGINPEAGFWFDWVRKVHDFCRNRYQHITCSPRAAMDGARILTLGKLFSIQKIAAMTVYKGVDAETVRAIEFANPLPKAA